MFGFGTAVGSLVLVLVHTHREGLSSQSHKIDSLTDIFDCVMVEEKASVVGKGEGVSPKKELLLTVCSLR
jgi:hypothetical protein